MFAVEVPPVDADPERSSNDPSDSSHHIRVCNYEPVQQVLDQWIVLAGCKTTPLVTEERRGRAGTPDATHTATRLAWPDCRDGVEVVHWKMTGVGHGWPGSVRPAVLQELVGPPTTVVNAAEEIWKFVSLFRLP